MAGGIWTWAATGRESVSCAVGSNEKERIVMIAAVESAGTKVPSTVIGKGKMLQCLAAFDLPPEIWGVTSQTD
jgi:hypothetical protein